MEDKQTMSDTPETDGKAYVSLKLTADGAEEGPMVVPVDFVRQMERERNEARRCFESVCIQSALVFAARYTHDRNTTGAFMVVLALKKCWHLLSDQTREQILRESHESIYNWADWEELRKFDKGFNALKPC
jgi:hypothetical protein